MQQGLALLASLQQREVLFTSLKTVHRSSLPSSAAWTTEHRSPQIALKNASILDGLGAVLSYYPTTMLQVHVLAPKATRILPSFATILTDDAGLGDDLPPSRVVGAAPLSRVRSSSPSPASPSALLFLHPPHCRRTCARFLSASREGGRRQ